MNTNAFTLIFPVRSPMGLGVPWGIFRVRPRDMNPKTPTQADTRCCAAAGQGAPVYYQTRRPTEAHVGSTICLDKTYLLDTGARRPCP